MAIAKKCDLCGKYYEQYNYKNSSSDTNGFMLLNIDANGKYWSHSPYDCCPDCMNHIRSTINDMYKGRKNTYAED